MSLLRYTYVPPYSANILMVEGPYNLTNGYIESLQVFLYVQLICESLLRTKYIIIICTHDTHINTL